MANIFLTSDQHYGHQGVCNFLAKDGVEKLRPWTNSDEMNEALVDNHNSVIKPLDKVYFLGDVVINKKYLSILHRLNGTKVLIKGNHDIFKLEGYTPFFYDIRAYHVLDNMIMSHIPVHSLSKGRYKGNLHGHLHDRRVPLREGHSQIDPWYLNVCVEQTNYTPISLEAAKQRFLDQQ